MKFKYENINIPSYMQMCFTYLYFFFLLSFSLQKERKKRKAWLQVFFGGRWQVWFCTDNLRELEIIPISQVWKLSKCHKKNLNSTMLTSICDCFFCSNRSFQQLLVSSYFHWYVPHLFTFVCMVVLALRFDYCYCYI